MELLCMFTLSNSSSSIAKDLKGVSTSFRKFPTTPHGDKKFNLRQCPQPVPPDDIQFMARVTVSRSLTSAVTYRTCRHITDWLTVTLVMNRVSSVKDRLPQERKVWVHFYFIVEILKEVENPFKVPIYLQ